MMIYLRKAVNYTALANSGPLCINCSKGHSDCTVSKAGRTGEPLYVYAHVYLGHMRLP